jgi:hypothetical protein
MDKAPPASASGAFLFGFNRTIYAVARVAIILSAKHSSVAPSTHTSSAREIPERCYFGTSGAILLIATPK